MSLLKYYQDKIIPRNFYQRETVVVAKELLGKYLVRASGDKTLVGKIVETEAYLPFEDPAAHNFVGKTLRNEVLFGEAGFTYVHSIHRYHCIDIVTEKAEVPGSVLIRALVPVDGIEIMMKNRRTNVLSNLLNGPGKICQAMMLTREQNWVDVCDFSSPIFVCIIEEDSDPNSITVSKRIGITKAADLLLRFNI